RSISGLGPAPPDTAATCRPARCGAWLLPRPATPGGGNLRQLLAVQFVLLNGGLLGGGGARGRLDRGRPAAWGSLLAADSGSGPLPAACRLASRIAGFVELHELVLAHGDGRYGLLALEDRIGNAGGIELDGPHGIVVARDHVIDPVRGAIGVHDGHHGNTELFRLIDRDLLVPDVDDEERIRQRLHVLDAAQALFELVHLAPKLGRLLLAPLVEGAGGRELGDLPEPLDRLADGLEVRQHAPQPSLIDIRLARALGLFLHGLARGALGTDEEHGAAVGDHALDELGRLRIERLRLLEIDDVDLVTLAEDERGHLRVPEAGL